MIFCQIGNELINIIKKYADGRIIVDCGCGDGLLGSLIREVISIDLFPRDTALINDIMYFDVREFPFKENMMPVFIRPCHSQLFVDATLRKIKEDKLVKDCLYISMPHNLEIDIDIEKFQTKQVEDWIGGDGEKIYLITFGGDI
jgi:hypothetical protein